ncbi:phosphatidylglycerophosphatase A [Alphaproteobacteria bacterium]|nr:phosphatidylglycerophosphatase A [Alphaproteobacteria bacterium]
MIKLHKLPDGLGFFHPAVLIGSFFGSGLLRPASGTWGSAFGLIPALLLGFYYGPFGLLLASGVVYLIGFAACRVWLSKSEDQDPSPIVIDEVAGLLLTLSCAPFTWSGIALGFVLFRAFDIFKPFPISWADKSIKGAHGVMLDDILAGGWAALVLLAVQSYGWL